MASTHNIYALYKKDTRYLVYWLIDTSNRLIKSSAAEKDEPPQGLNTSGQVTVSGLLSISELIAQHSEPVPSFIYRLFLSIISARSTVYGAFQQLHGSKSDPEVQRNNASHKHFIDTLMKAFTILGGEAWQSGNSGAQEPGQEELDLEQIIFGNRFSALKIEDQEGYSSAEDDGFQVSEQASAPQRAVAKKSSAKGKKGKKSKKAKKSKKGKATTNIKEATLEDVPLESIKIIESGGGLVTDYLMAVYSAVKDWVSLRAFVQGVWKEVAYEGLNGASAGAISNVAINMIKQAGSTIFVDYPGHDDYETIMNTITRGNPDTAQGNFYMAMHRVDPRKNISEKVIDNAVDVKEQFLIYAYQDLLDFVTDFQATRSGKPTKAMSAKLANWDPKFNLETATTQQRLDWRRSYTINWLYDLVNVFSSIVVQRNTLKGEKHAYETVDWSVTGPWNSHRRLFGLNEFAGAITSLAMKKPGTNVKKSILPHHVFQLQCIVDAFTVSRGWFLSTLRGHVLEAPAKEFRPRRDVDLFLDRDMQRTGRGFLQAVSVVKQIFQKDGLKQGDPNRLRAHFDVLEVMQVDFIDWLGLTKYMYGLNTIPPSRFSNHNANGLYEYSPFLCGVGLMEGLELAYGFSMELWDSMPEPMLLVHLHNMLVRKGLITKPVGLYLTLEDMFKESFFVDGQVPTSNFYNALMAKMGESGSHFLHRQRSATRKRAAAGNDIHAMLNLDANRFFRRKSNLMVYRAADWNPDRIPDKDVAFGTFLFFQRLFQAKLFIDPVTKETRFEDTFLVREAKANGLDDKEMLRLRESFLKGRSPEMDTLPPSFMESVAPNGELAGELPKLTGGPSQPRDVRLAGRDLLSSIQADIRNDVSGTMPVSSLNYIWVTCYFFMLFMKIEDRLKELENPLYLRAYNSPSPWGSQKRSALVSFVMQVEDEECMRVMADLFDESRTGFMSHIYWEDLELSDSKPKTRRKPVMDEADMCTVM